VDNIDNTVPL